MAHEMSETVKRGDQWFVIDTVGKNKGKILIGPFKSSDDADRAASERSRAFGKRKKNTKPGNPFSRLNK